MNGLIHERKIYISIVYTKLGMQTQLAQVWDTPQKGGWQRRLF